MIPQGFQSDLQELITYKVDKTLKTFPILFQKLLVKNENL